MSQIVDGHISILIATRARPEMLSEVFESLKANTQRKDQTALWLYVDEDDQVTRQAIEGKKFPDPGFPVHWHIGPQTASLGETHEALWQASSRASAIYMVSVDDARFDTPGWDEILRKAFAAYPDGVLLAFPHDPMTADTATYPIFGWRWLATLQRFFPGYFPFWYDDRWVGQVGRLAGRLLKLPILLYPIRGKGRTRRMRNLPFWTRFFQLTLAERKDSARKLIAAIHLEDQAAQAPALAAMEEVAAALLKEEGAFSDIYSVFQEERHTDLTPEEREVFDPKYFQQEALAVSRLIAIAREHIARKRFAEAMEFLDATQFSDLRVRQAQAAKAQCLRALGRTAEAERVASEQLAAWPDLAGTRRLFRLVGAVANDAKRLLVGLTERGKHGGGSAAAATDSAPK
jgi:tetratricopeptide (TPR) repeat protein